jgi:hypothetical protein
MKTENGNEVLTNNDNEKAETLSKFFSSFFTNEGDGDIHVFCYFLFFTFNCFSG